ncbi:DMT family transporter [Lipingzhangella sp. LS1_29]|uniref:DMT family transporter n=1 Tax=Lipingzhangella rawalii TaxID=2055835 RepID=A0ABU2H1V3_9ACTN|nr:DMT family transporter [Lipingzhangella rawalii]MDS1268982.1 DMT family transporter [Lipingzhangella rawalii]
MTTLVVAAVLTAALLHASWNAIAHAITDRFVGFALISVGGAVCSGLLLPAAGVPHPASWGYLGVSVLLHVVYLALLMLSYRLGDFGQVYPLARGLAPLAVTVAAAVFIGETLAPTHLLGVLVISCGLLSLVFAAGRPGRGQVPALVAAAGTGLMIASYTVVDGVGVRLSGDVFSYTIWLAFLHFLVFSLVLFAIRGPVLVRQLRMSWWQGLLGGVISIAAYGLVLWAQTMSPLAGVAALREASIVFGAMIGAVFFQETFGRMRVLAAATVATGIVLLNLHV